MIGGLVAIWVMWQGWRQGKRRRAIRRAMRRYALDLQPSGDILRMWEQPLREAARQHGDNWEREFRKWMETPQVIRIHHTTASGA